MDKESIIKKYNLKKYDNKDKFIGKINYESYSNKIKKDNVIINYLLENEMSTELDNGKIFFLTINKIDFNNLIYDKRTQQLAPKTSTTIKQYEF